MSKQDDDIKAALIEMRRELWALRGKCQIDYAETNHGFSLVLASQLGYLLEHVNAYSSSVALGLTQPNPYDDPEGNADE